MLIRTILVAVSGGVASAGVVDTACRLARRFHSHLEGLHIVGPSLAPAYAAVSLPLTGMLGEARLTETGDAATAARRLFDTAIARYALPRRGSAPLGALSGQWEASASWREDMAADSTAFAQRARLFDLIVLGRSTRAIGQPSGRTIEQALLHAGRPVLVVPSSALAKLGDIAVVAWNDTPEASRALSAAMPLLMEASETHILCFGDMQIGTVIEQLAWYGVRATGHRFPPLAEQRVETGELLLAVTRDFQADLLVMGAYSHAPWWESLFGGATREVLSKNSIPILLVH
jgi:nucleotide-binding universal stress UspA family protein